jgi:hypothetical protein
MVNVGIFFIYKKKKLHWIQNVKQCISTISVLNFDLFCNEISGFDCLFGLVHLIINYFLSSF